MLSAQCFVTFASAFCTSELHTAALCLPSRGRHRFPVGPQQEADDFLPERAPAAARETGLLFSHVRRTPADAPSCANFSSTPVFAVVLLCKPLPHHLPLCVRPGPVSSRRPALCRTSSASLTSGPSLSVTRRPSNLAPSTTSLRSSPVKKSFYPGKPRV